MLMLAHRSSPYVARRDAATQHSSCPSAPLLKHAQSKRRSTWSAGLQITALGNPKLLERVAAGLTAIRNLFSQFDQDMNNVITREEFAKVTLLPKQLTLLYIVCMNTISYCFRLLMVTRTGPQDASQITAHISVCSEAHACLQHLHCDRNHATLT